MRRVFAAVTAAVVMTAGAAEAGDPVRGYGDLRLYTPEEAVNQICHALKREEGQVCTDAQRAQLLILVRKAYQPKRLTPRA